MGENLKIIQSMFVSNHFFFFEGKVKKQKGNTNNHAQKKSF
jgi:hypothetical protein